MTSFTSIAGYTTFEKERKLNLENIMVIDLEDVGQMDQLPLEDFVSSKLIRSQGGVIADSTGILHSKQGVANGGCIYMFKDYAAIIYDDSNRFSIRFSQDYNKNNLTYVDPCFYLSTMASVLMGMPPTSLCVGGSFIVESFGNSVSSYLPDFTSMVAYKGVPAVYYGLSTGSFSLELIPSNINAVKKAFIRGYDPVTVSKNFNKDEGVLLNSTTKTTTNLVLKQLAEGQKVDISNSYLYGQFVNQLAKVSTRITLAVTNPTRLAYLNSKNIMLLSGYIDSLNKTNKNYSCFIGFEAQDGSVEQILSSYDVYLKQALEKHEKMYFESLLKFSNQIMSRFTTFSCMIEKLYKSGNMECLFNSEQFKIDVVKGTFDNNRESIVNFLDGNRHLLYDLTTSDPASIDEAFGIKSSSEVTEELKGRLVSSYDNSISKIIRGIRSQISNNKLKFSIGDSDHDGDFKLSSSYNVGYIYKRHEHTCGVEPVIKETSAVAGDVIYNGNWINTLNDTFIIPTKDGYRTIERYTGTNSASNIPDGINLTNIRNLDADLTEFIIEMDLFPYASMYFNNYQSVIDKANKTILDTLFATIGGTVVSKDFLGLVDDDVYPARKITYTPKKEIVKCIWNCDTQHVFYDGYAMHGFKLQKIRRYRVLVSGLDRVDAEHEIKNISSSSSVTDKDSILYNKGVSAAHSAAYQYLLEMLNSKGLLHKVRVLGLAADSVIPLSSLAYFQGEVALEFVAKYLNALQKLLDSEKMDMKEQEVINDAISTLRSQLKDFYEITYNESDHTYSIDANNITYPNVVVDDLKLSPLRFDPDILPLYTVI